MSATVINAVLDALTTASTGLWVGEELPPHTELEQNLPAVVVEDVPGDVADQPWGGAPLTHVVALDIEVFARDLDAARTIGAAIELILHHLVVETTNPITAVNQAETFHKRPDWNPRVKRVGAEFRLRATTA